MRSRSAANAASLVWASSLPWSRGGAARARPRGRWERGGMWFWARQAGDSGDGQAAPTELPEPYALLRRGEWRASAAWWQARGCRYEHAMTLSLSGDADALRESVR